VYVDIRDRDLGGYVQEAQRVVREQVPLPAGYSIGWSGQYEYLERAQERLALVVPFVLLVIVLLLWLAFRDARNVALILLSLPFALVGGVWLVALLGHDLSVAGAVGFIALAGVAAEFGVLMVVYLDLAVARRRAEGRLQSVEDLRAAVIEGAALRVRPKAMTVATIMAGLLPLFFGSGAGSDVMQRIAAPMLGGMVTAPLLSMLVVPVLYYLLHRRESGSGAG
jgi:Cu(I)/Ag(I) efflux system membrane protein CusA/SilA